MGPGLLLLSGLVVAGAMTAILWPQGGILARARKGAHLSRRVLVEDALKYLYKAEARAEWPSLDSLAGALSVSRNRVAEVVDRMNRDGLLRFEQHGVRPTEAGREAALHVIRAHRLWEHYLSEETGYSEGEWHSRAEVQEHTLSPAATEALSRRLGNPVYDPHGDPIPSVVGTDPVRSRGAPLTLARVGTRLRISHLEDEPDIVYAQLVAEGIYPGMGIHVIDSTPQKIRFWANGEVHTLAPVVAQNVSVVELDKEPAEEEFADGEPLLKLPLGDQATVIGIASSCRGAERRRFLDLGLVPGTTVVAEMRSPSGDPTAYRIRESLIALRGKQAQHIRIRRNSEQ